MRLLACLLMNSFRGPTLSPISTEKILAKKKNAEKRKKNRRKNRSFGGGFANFVRQQKTRLNRSYSVCATAKVGNSFFFFAIARDARFSAALSLSCDKKALALTLPIRGGRVVDRDELEGPSSGVHGGVPQLLRHHLSETLEALQLDRWRRR